MATAARVRELANEQINPLIKGDEAMPSRVLSPVDHAHSGAKLLDDAVVQDGLADRWSRILLLRNVASQ
jgi:hypothetical protein